MVMLQHLNKKTCFFCFLFFGLVVFSLRTYAESPQHRWAGDVPIMNKLQIEPELGFAFDSPNGRIVMIFASTTVPSSEIMAFYSSTLAQLGWRGNEGTWLRGSEKLRINIVETVRGPLWRIFLRPN